MSEFHAISSKTPNKVVCENCGRVLMEGIFRVEVVYKGKRFYLGKLVSCCKGEPRLVPALFASAEAARHTVDFDIHDCANGYDLLEMSEVMHKDFSAN